MNALSDTLRELMDRHDLTGVKLAEEIGISAVSVSHILTGKSCPRQVTLSRMMKRLCENPRDEQALLSAYESLRGENVPVSPVVDDEANAATDEARVRRFMEVKAQSIAFKRSVARELDKAGVTYRQDVTENLVVTDFLVEVGSKRVALECKFNLHRDMAKSLISARLIRQQFDCDEVLIVVPFYEEEDGDDLESKKNIRILPLQDLADLIDSWINS